MFRPDAESQVPECEATSRETNFYSSQQFSGQTGPIQPGGKRHAFKFRSKTSASKITRIAPLAFLDARKGKTGDLCGLPVVWLAGIAVRMSHNLRPLLSSFPGLDRIHG